MIDEYERVNWVNGETPVNETNLNKMDLGIKNNNDAIGQLQTDVSGKQATLVSGENIVTINGQTLLNSGNITIKGNDIPTITIALAQVLTTGQDSYTYAKFIRINNLTSEQETTLANEDYPVIKLDVSALYAQQIVPAPYIWVKRNTQTLINNIELIQFSCGGEEFWYENYQTDIAIKNVGCAALVYVPSLHIFDLTMTSISMPDYYAGLGISMNLGQSIQKGEGDYSLEQKGNTTNHVKGASAIGDSSVGFGIGDSYEYQVTNNMTTLVFANDVIINTNWQNMVVKCGNEYRRILSVDVENKSITITSAFSNPSETITIQIITQVALGEAAMVNGKYSQAFETAGHAEGIACKSTAEAAHAEGYYTLANQSYAHSSGMYTVATGIAAYAGGIGTWAGQNYQTVVGKYNDNKATSLFEVGNGTDASHKDNALVVYQDGHVVVGGMGSNPGNKTVTTKEYVDGGLALKRDITESRKVVYATSATETSSGSGKYTQTEISYSSGLNNGCIVQRDGTQILVPQEPTDVSHATSKKYVDDNIGATTEIANQKSKSYIIKHDETTPTSSSDYQIYYYYDAIINTYKAFISQAEFNTWLQSKICVNSYFNSQDDEKFIANTGQYSYTQYVVLSNMPTPEGSSMAQKLLITIAQLRDMMHLGDTILVTNVNIPNRWLKAKVSNLSSGLLLAREGLSKNDISNVVTTNGSGTQTITGDIKFGDNNLTIFKTGGAPALKLSSDSSGWAGTTILQAGTPGGATRTITLPSTDGTLLTKESADNTYAKKGVEEIVTLADNITFTNNGASIPIANFQDGQGNFVDGLYFFTYSYSQAFVYLSYAMLTNSYGLPIRASMPVWNSGDTNDVPGSIRIKKDGNYIKVWVTNGTQTQLNSKLVVSRCNLI